MDVVAKTVIASEAKQSTLPRKERMDWLRHVSSSQMTSISRSGALRQIVVGVERFQRIVASAWHPAAIFDQQADRVGHVLVGHLNGLALGFRRAMGGIVSSKPWVSVSILP